MAVRFFRGSSWFHVVTGDDATIVAWLKEHGVPLSKSVTPKEAGKDAIIVSVKYVAKTCRSGPNQALAMKLEALRHALVAGDADAVRTLCAQVPSAMLALALGVVRATTDGATASCLNSLARTMLREPVPRRSRPKELILEEEVLRRVAEASAGSDAKLFEACLQRLDAIERDAEKQSDWAQTSGVDVLAAALVDGGHKREAYDAYEKLVLRGRESHWIHVNRGLLMLLMSTTGRIVLVGHVARFVRACETRMKDLGDKNPVAYNLACVYARAGDATANPQHTARPTALADEAQNGRHVARCDLLEARRREPAGARAMAAPLEDERREPGARDVPRQTKTDARIRECSVRQHHDRTLRAGARDLVNRDAGAVVGDGVVDLSGVRTRCLHAGLDALAGALSCTR